MSVQGHTQLAACTHARSHTPHTRAYALRCTHALAPAFCPLSVSLARLPSGREVGTPSVSSRPGPSPVLTGSPWKSGPDPRLCAHNFHPVCVGPRPSPADTRATDEEGARGASLCGEEETQGLGASRSSYPHPHPHSGSTKDPRPGVMGGFPGLRTGLQHRLLNVLSCSASSLCPASQDRDDGRPELWVGTGAAVEGSQAPPHPSSWPLDPALDSSKLGRGAIQPGLALGREGDHPGQRGEDRMDSQRCRHFQRAWADWAPRWQGERRRVRWLGLGRRWGAAQYN